MTKQQMYMAAAGARNDHDQSPFISTLNVSAIETPSVADTSAHSHLRATANSLTWFTHSD